MMGQLSCVLVDQRLDESARPQLCRLQGMPYPAPLLCCAGACRAAAVTLFSRPGRAETGSAAAQLSGFPGRCQWRVVVSPLRVPGFKEALRAFDSWAGFIRGTPHLKLHGRGVPTRARVSPVTFHHLHHAQSSVVRPLSPSQVPGKAPMWSQVCGARPSRGERDQHQVSLWVRLADVQTRISVTRQFPAPARRLATSTVW